MHEGGAGQSTQGQHSAAIEKTREPANGLASSQKRSSVARLVLFNLRYSPNLGDSLLCECLEYGLQQAVPGLQMVALDLGGRRDFALGSSRRLAALMALQRLPLMVRQFIARTMIGRSLRRVMPYWQTQLATADAVVLGGGNLFADADLNFPLKIAAAFEAVSLAGLPAAVHAVGVADNWSREGEALFRRALTTVRLTHAAVRDERSQEIWVQRLGPAGIARPHIVHDPGLLASECYPAQNRSAMPGMRVGICVIHPVALRYHADEETPGSSALTQWLTALVQGFTQKGYATVLFTTGSAEDETYLDRVMPVLLAGADRAGTVTRMPRFPRAGDMARFISTLDLVLAHRLHACVAAYSYGVPHIGFTWDVKMRSFFDSVERSHFLRGAVTTSAAEVMRLAEEAIRIGISPDDRRAVLDDTRADIAALLNTLSSALRD